MPKVLDPETMTPQQRKQQQANARKKERRVRQELDDFYAKDRPGGLSAFYRSPEFQMVYGPKRSSHDGN